ncbi:MAG: CRISPR-associated helicase Cas3' [Aquimonas sp.]|nr:CRISPR-associated helicase Cas3' [Aquimonas sp.]
MKALSYWGKANPRHHGAARWHLLPFHALDVAAVARVYLYGRPKLLAHFAVRLGLHADATLDWLCFWIALHDLGKFATTFQALCPEALAQLQQRESQLRYGERHDTLGDFLWKDRLYTTHDALALGAQKAAFKSALNPWVAAVTGHHGQPPRAVRMRLCQNFKDEDVAAAAEFLHATRALLLPDARRDEVLAVGPERLRTAGTDLSWWLAGLTVLADWLGSNTDYFPYRDQPCELQAYWQQAQTAAAHALAATELMPCPAAEAQTVAELFGWRHASHTPTPLQHWAEHVELADGPQLFLLEDVTGAGKTEAALMLAHRVMAAGHADGLFMGLPTMATTNAMFARLQAVVPRLYKPADSRPSYVLAHGQRNQVEGFRSSVVPVGAVEPEGLGEADTASARCAAWLADSNKKALLAHVGVGTLDQALLAVLHARHQSLRLLGLFRKVLIVDEVHACDAYMQRLLEAVLEFHAAAGGSVVLLSATLPARMKNKLAQAYARGRGVTAPQLQSSRYPLAAQVSDRGARESALETRPSVQRRVQVSYIDSRESVEAEIRSALSAGRCVCWIRNTVGDAIKAWRSFSEALPSDHITLFHARFTLADRLRIEADVLACFGPESTSAQRGGRLVISTQVIEQSLDVDFDLLVSDLAPIDRLIQRAGRLQRHRRDVQGDLTEREDQRGGARLLVYGPAWTPQPEPQWYSRFSRGSAFVYSHPGQVWLSARLLQRGFFDMPEDARTMIEGVFGDEAQADIPQGLEALSERQEGVDWAATNHAHSRILKRALGYQRGDFGDWWSDEVGTAVDAVDEWAAGAETRLGEPSCVLRLAVWKGDALAPLQAEANHPWEASSLRVPAAMLGEPRVNRSAEAALERLKEALPDKGKWSKIAILSPMEGGWSFCSEVRDGRSRRFEYRSDLGLAVSAAETATH